MIEINDWGWLAEERKTTKYESANKGTEEGIEGRVAYKYKTIFHFYEKVGKLISFVSTQISNLHISEVCQSAKCKSANLEWLTDRVTNGIQIQHNFSLVCKGGHAHFAHFLCLTVHKSQMRKFARTKAVFLIPVRSDLPQIFFYTYVSHVTVKPKVVLKFEWEHFKLTFVRRKIMYLRVCLANRKSSNCTICRRSANLKKEKSENLRICDLWNLFAEAHICFSEP